MRITRSYNSSSGLLERIPFPEIWVADFEFGAPPGGLQEPRCLAAKELRSGKTVRLWADELRQRSPFDVRQSLFVAHYASAEMRCFQRLGWPLPAFVLDTYIEHRRLTNGLFPAAKPQSGLLAALNYHGLESISAVEKKEMIALALRGGAYSCGERADLLRYCECDVDGEVGLLAALLPDLDRLENVCLRGRYMKAAARMEDRGLPIDLPLFEATRKHWKTLRRRIVKRHAAASLYDRDTFKQERFRRLVMSRGWVWPTTETGALRLDDRTFRALGVLYPEVNSIRELRSTLAALRMESIAIGPDGRNRTLLSAFFARSSRNAPSNSKSIFGPSTWIRGFLKPERDRALAYLDWRAQEFGVAASLSGDENMLAAYRSGDPYLWMAKIAGKAPPHATKKTHKEIRGVFKVVALALLYGMRERSLALQAGMRELEAKQLLWTIEETFQIFHQWSQDRVDTAMAGFPLSTCFGWQIRASVPFNDKPNTFRNFLVQASSAEMMRLAAIVMTEAGLPVC